MFLVAGLPGVEGQNNEQDDEDTQQEQNDEYQRVVVLHWTPGRLRAPVNSDWVPAPAVLLQAPQRNWRLSIRSLPPPPQRMTPNNCQRTIRNFRIRCRSPPV